MDFGGAYVVESVVKVVVSTVVVVGSGVVVVVGPGHSTSSGLSGLHIV